MRYNKVHEIINKHLSDVNKRPLNCSTHCRVVVALCMCNEVGERLLPKMLTLYT